MPVNINADTVVGGAVVTADASGVLALQAAGSTQVTINTSGVTLANPLPVASGGTGSASGVNLATSVTGTLPIANGGTGTTSTTFVNLATNVTGTLPVANGGTGAASFTANRVLLGNGTSAFQTVAPGTSGNVLTSNGTTWASSAPSGLVQLGQVTGSISTGSAASVSLPASWDTNYKYLVFTISGAMSMTGTSSYFFYFDQQYSAANTYYRSSVVGANATSTLGATGILAPFTTAATASTNSVSLWGVVFGRSGTGATGSTLDFPTMFAYGSLGGRDAGYTMGTYRRGTVGGTSAPSSMEFGNVGGGTNSISNLVFTVWGAS